MNIGVLLIVLGLLVGFLLHWGLGVVMVVVGIVLLLLPRLRA